MSGAMQAELEFQRTGGLVDRALSALGEGPQPTAALAVSVLGLRGNPKAAAAAVFALLGADPRFAVDASGVWSLAAQAPPPDVPLRAEEWVVVDVETTGGSAGQGHRITEFAAVRISGGEIRDTYRTLVNPERPIPAMITSLTGITDAMVRNAPPFAEIAGRVGQTIRGCVFVAHNASFDWGFVCAEMERSLGRVPAGRRLCTVRLARKLLPELPSRSLDALALYFGLSIESRHRALDDAVATAHVLLRFIDMLEERDCADWPTLERVLGSRAPRRKRTRMPTTVESP